MNIPLFFAIAFAAETLGTIAGFGSATIMTSVASFFMDIKAAITFAAFFHFFGNSWRIWFFRGHVDWPLFWQFGLSGIALSFAGAALAVYLPPLTIMTIFGCFLIIYAWTSLLMPRSHLKANKSTAIIGGVATGFVAGVIGTGGALRSAFLAAFDLEKNRYIATSAMIALVVDATRIPIYLFSGALSRPGHQALLPPLILIAFLGAKTGQALVTRLPQQIFKRIVLAGLFLAGLKLVHAGLAL